MNITRCAHLRCLYRCAPEYGVILRGIIGIDEQSFKPDSSGYTFAACLIAALSGIAIVWFGIPWISSSYLTGVAGDPVPLGYFVTGIVQPIPTSFLCYFLLALCVSVLALRFLKTPERLLAFAFVAGFGLFGLESVAQHIGAKKARFLVASFPDEKKWTAIVYRNKSAVLGKEIDPTTGQFTAQSGILMFPNPDRELGPSLMYLNHLY